MTPPDDPTTTVSGLHRVDHPDPAALAAERGAELLTSMVEVDQAIARFREAEVMDARVVAHLRLIVDRVELARRVIDRTLHRSAEALSERLSEPRGAAVAIHPSTIRNAAADVARARAAVEQAARDLEALRQEVANRPAAQPPEPEPDPDSEPEVGATDPQPEPERKPGGSTRLGDEPDRALRSEPRWAPDRAPEESGPEPERDPEQEPEPERERERERERPSLPRREGERQETGTDPERRSDEYDPFRDLFSDEGTISEARRIRMRVLVVCAVCGGFAVLAPLTGVLPALPALIPLFLAAVWGSWALRGSLDSLAEEREGSGGLLDEMMAPTDDAFERRHSHVIVHLPRGERDTPSTEEPADAEPDETEDEDEPPTEPVPISWPAPEEPPAEPVPTPRPAPAPAVDRLAEWREEQRLMAEWDEARERELASALSLAEEELRVAERHWHELAGPDADPDDVDEVVRRLDPQHQDALLLASETATVRAANVLLDRATARWIETWTRLGRPVPPLDQAAEVVAGLAPDEGLVYVCAGSAVSRAGELALAVPTAAVLAVSSGSAQEPAEPTRVNPGRRYSDRVRET
jgi:outer membrane biosynthesis protein TonB